MLAIERKKHIMDFLRENKTLSVTELADRFQSSKETIRRDLRDFEKQGLVRKTHGGAVLVEDGEKTAFMPAVTGPYFAELPIDIRRACHSTEKEVICELAVKRLNSKDVIYIDNSSTTISLVKFIPPDLNITVLTNSILVITEAYKLNNPNLSIFCAPGFFNSNNLSLYGNQTVKMVEEFFPNKAFISCAAVMPDSRLADSSMYEIDTKRAFMGKSDKVFLLADADKFNQSAPYLLSDMDLVDCIITDSRNPHFNWQRLETKSVEVIVGDEQP